MFWFKTGLVINCTTIAGVLINALYDAFTLSYGTSHNGWFNFMGFVIAVLVLVAYNLKISGNLKAANILLWIPAFPASVLLIFFLISAVVIMLSDSGWQ
jgi:hypothetical protein